MDGTARKRDVSGGKSPVPLDPEELAAEARQALEPGPRAYLFGGAESEGTMRANRRAFERYRIRPRVLRDTSSRDHRVRVGDEELAHPLVCAPVGMQSLYDDEGETATARAAVETGATYCLSTVSTASLESVAAAQDERATATPLRWFQLYWSGREVTREFVRRAEDAGYTALVLTVDAPVTGWRVRELQSGFVPFDHGHGLGNYTTSAVVRERLDVPADASPDEARVAGVVRDCLGDASLDWDDVSWLRDLTDLPVYLKGVCHPADARRAVDAADGVVVSNHGGRQVDGELAAIDALEPVASAVGGDIPVLFDSGVRTGADVFRALALGADAVLLGRPLCYGLTLAGQAGAEAVIRNLRAAFDLTLELAGYANADAVDRGAVVRVGETSD